MPNKVLTKVQVYLLGFITLFGFSILSGILLGFSDKTFQSIFASNVAAGNQLIYGLIYGSVASLLALALVRSRYLSDVRNYYAEIISSLKLNLFDITFLSFCAGTGEELLFRGAVQGYLGIWITSIVFVALHGYLNPLKIRLMVYGIFMVFVIAGIGYLFSFAGILSAMTAHFTIDMVLISYLSYFAIDKDSA